jgi:HEAT repeat protein
VFALGGRSDSVAVEALIRLTTHNDAIVRDWATFGLGAKGKLDTPEIREALHRRLNDDDPIIRYEAICGLVRCGDLRAIDPLIAALSEDPAEGALWIPACSLLKTEYYELTATDLVSMLQSLRESANLEKR